MAERRLIVWLAGVLLAGAAWAEPADDAALEARLQRLAGELRCPVCQNQTLAESDTALAKDLRAALRTLLQRGAGDGEARRFMTDRYGDFVLYKPPLRPDTWVLWWGPALLLATALVALAGVLWRRGARPVEAPDTEPASDPHWPRRARRRKSGARRR